jgi:hypothetical protein
MRFIFYLTPRPFGQMRRSGSKESERQSYEDIRGIKEAAGKCLVVRQRAGRGCHSGRMMLIVMPSSHHLQLIQSSPIEGGPRRMRACANGRAWHLVWCRAKTASVISFINRQATTLCLLAEFILTIQPI